MAGTVNFFSNCGLTPYNVSIELEAACAVASAAPREKPLGYIIGEQVIRPLIDRARSVFARLRFFSQPDRLQEVNRRPLLKVELNRPPISHIEIAGDLETVSVFIDEKYLEQEGEESSQEYQKAHDVVMAVIRSGFGGNKIHRNEFQAFGLKNIQNTAANLQKEWPGFHDIDGYQKLLAEGFVHTAELVINSLQEAKFLTSEQREEINSIIQRHTIEKKPGAAQ
jgi:hypothetical protein